MFDSVNDSFAKYMLEMKTLQNVIKACTGSQPDPTPGVDNAMLERFTNMDEKLEKIQKSLENYLEKKRQQFPRFYFISSDDLLEILGQAKNPPNVQPHFKGMFEGIKKLEMTKPGTDGRKTFASTAMHSQTARPSRSTNRSSPTADRRSGSTTSRLRCTRRARNRSSRR